MASIPEISFPVPANGKGKVFNNTDEMLRVLAGESSGLYLVGSQGMWHGGIHITDATVPWCALSGSNPSELDYVNKPYTGEQAVRCMADGEIVAYRVCEDYDFIAWRGDKLYFSTSFVLVKHYIQPGANAASGLTFYTLYMNLAPVSAYGQPDANIRETAKRQSYYTSADKVNTGRATGLLPAGTRVKLGDRVMTSSKHHRQFCEVTVVNDTGSLKAGDKIWTVSDRGWLKPLSGQAAQPSWWRKCLPACHAGTGGEQAYKASTALKVYLSTEDMSAGKEVSGSRLPKDFPVTTGSSGPSFTRASDKRIFSLVTLNRDIGPKSSDLKKGDRVWVISDNDNLTVVEAASAGQPKYGEVVIPETPVAISAGDSIGHLGFYQLPDEDGKRSRYQVHIECLTPDDKLPTFLTNPDKAGEDNPAYLSYAEGATLFMPDATGKMVSTERKSRAPGILTRSKVPGVDANGKVLTDNTDAAYYQVRPEGGWMAASDVKKVAQFDLASLGFVTLDKTPESFDLIDGIHHPDNVVKGILAKLYEAARQEKNGSRILNQYNYERLLKQIDKNSDGQYSEQEYLLAVHNPSYRDHLYRIIVKHPSEWYYGKDDACWKTYLNTLAKDTSLAEWKAYTEAFIEKMKWMKQVPGMVADPWHMHPVTFLGALKNRSKWFDIEKFIKNYKKQHSVVFGFYDRGRKITISDLTQESESSLRNLLNEMELQYYVFFDDFNPRFIAYMLATIRIESYDYKKKLFFKPISENISYEKAERDYGSGPTASNRQRALLNHNAALGDGYKYRGRGFVQLTWKISYEKFKSITGIDIVSNPDLCLEIDTAVSIMMKGMKDGGFRGGHTLERYLGNGNKDYFNARLIINGYRDGVPDKADEFEDYAKLFEVLINEATDIFFVSLLTLPFFSCSNSDVGINDCTSEKNISCAAVLKINKNDSDTSFKVELVDAKTNRLIFPYFERNETMESISLQKYGKKYVFTKEYLDSTNALEFITFIYYGQYPLSTKYFYIESSVDFNGNSKIWSGKECETSLGTIPGKKGGLLLQASSRLCINKVKLKYLPNEYHGEDVLFFISKVVNGNEKYQVPVIALDSKNSDSINLHDIGCLDFCVSDADVVNFIGKLDDRFRVNLHLNYHGRNVTGFYFYEKTKEKINVSGYQVDDRLVLSASVHEGKEIFDGVLEKGTFKGMWSNAEKSKKYPFSFYVSLVQ